MPQSDRRNAGYPSITTDSNFCAPQIINRLNAAARKTLTTPELAKKLATAGLDPDPSSPEEFGKLIRSEIAKWRKVIKEAGITSH
jgi:tripartite-type tricarboxylate transporter receptor subunit TctC